MLMTRGSVLVVSLTAVMLALVPWRPLAGDERQPIPNSPLPTAAALPTCQPSPTYVLAPHTDSYCLTCHGNPSLQTRFADGGKLSLHVDARALRDSAHGLLTCTTCHADHEVCPPGRAEPLDSATYRIEATEMCISCHLAAAGDYAESAHGQPVLTDSGDGATCNDCHALEPSGHAVGWVSDPSLMLSPQSVDENCGRCHEDALRTYRHTSHSKVARFGDPDRPANCTTCHGDHAVKAVDDPDEPMTAANLVTVCGDCHDGADESFASGWRGHAASSSRSAGVYFTERSLVFLIATGLAFGLVHMALDLRRRLDGRWRGGGSDRG